MGLVILRNNEEIGQLLDYKIDLAYGSDENDYTLDTIEQKMSLGDMWVIEETEYGGIVDKIDAKSNNPTLKYSGRSLQGILAGYHTSQIGRSATFFLTSDRIKVAGTVSAILAEIKSTFLLPFEVEGTDDEINEETDRFMDLYSFFKEIFEKNTLKIKFSYSKETGFVLSVVNAIDFSKNQAEDLTELTTSLTIGKYVPNHYIGINRDGENVRIKHFFADDQHNFDGFYRLDEIHDTPVYDEEYERFNSEQKIFGKDEIVEVIENNSVVTNYDVVTEKNTNEQGLTEGNTIFYHGVPFDWTTNYTDYYYKEVDAEGNESYKNFEVHEEFKPYTPESNWAEIWQNYYKKSNGNYMQLTEADCTVTDNGYYGLKKNVIQDVVFGEKFDDFWMKNFNKFFTRQRINNQWVYFSVQGEPVYYYSKQTKKPSDWNEQKGNYYIQWQRPCWDVYAERQQGGKWVKIGDTIRILDSLSNGSPDGKKTFADYFSSNSTKQQRKTIPPKNGTRWTVSSKKTYFNKKVTVDYYCQELKIKLNKIKWESGKFFLRIEAGKKAPKFENGIYFGKAPDTISSYPPTSGTYYQKGDFLAEPFALGKVYKKVEDHYSGIVKKIQESMEKYLSKTQSLKADFSPNHGEYDVGDIVAGRHPLTNEFLFCKISKKIVKVTPNKTEISYDVY